MTRSVYTKPLRGCNDDIQYLPPGVYRIQSPNYEKENPGNYPNDYKCSYHFQPTDANGILRFNCWFFQLQDSDNCEKDYFHIDNNGICNKYCGKDTPSSFLTNRLSIDVVTDSSVTDKGFFCTIMSKESEAGCKSTPCGTRYVYPGKYVLQTKNYPEKYGTNLYCKWQLIAVKRSSSMELSCTKFDMISWDNTCEWDWMRVNGVRYCNNNPPATPIKSSGSIMTVEYSTPDLPLKVRDGFSCTVTVTEGESAVKN